MPNDMSPDETERCPECGSNAISEKGIAIEGSKSSLESSWDSCINCGWEDR